MAGDSTDDDFFENSLNSSKKSIAELNQPQTEKPLHYTYVFPSTHCSICMLYFVYQAETVPKS